MHPNLLQQLRVFLTVAQSPSIASAAKSLNKTVSALSYTISTLEQHLDLKLFDRSEYRLALTPAGKALVDDVEILNRRAELFESRVGQLRNEEIVDITISVDPIFPPQILTAAIKTFCGEYPESSFKIAQDNWDAVVENIRSERADLGLCRIDPRMSMKEITGKQIGNVQHMIVAAHDHPLVQLGRPVLFADLEMYPQLVHTAFALANESDDEPSLLDTYVHHITSHWLIDDRDSHNQILKDGLGWAYATKFSAARELQDGDLVVLDCSDVTDWNIFRLFAISRASMPLSGGLQRFIDLLGQEFAGHLDD